MLNFCMLQVDWLYKTTFKKGLGDSMYVLTRRNNYSLHRKGENRKGNKWKATLRENAPLHSIPLQCQLLVPCKIGQNQR